MKDIPIFTTEFGVASLVLKEIPYQGAAYITVQSSQEPEQLLQECVGFCRACGAERLYATGHPILEQKPLYTAVWEMRCPVSSLPDTDAALWPVQEEHLETWRKIYNDKVTGIPNAAWMSQLQAREMIQKGDGYFVHRGGQLLGIGRASGGRIDWVAAVAPNAGREVVCALAHALSEETAVLTVASENKKAVRLYESLGFVRCKEISKWYVL